MKLPAARALVIAVAISAIFHAAPAAIAKLRSATRAEPVRGEVRHLGLIGLERGAAYAEVPSRRREIVARARIEIALGQLALGRFLIEASALDADERREPLDRARAEGMYDERVARLRNELRTADLLSAVRSVFGDLHYVLTTANLPSTLLDGGGNCEGLSHTIAAAVHDAGFPGLVGLKYWGGGGQAAHLAPVYRGTYRGSSEFFEFDLVAGGPAHRGGTRVEALSLVEGYARARGVGAVSKAASGGAQVAFLEDARPWMTYPQNGEAFPGALPIYAEQAIGNAWSSGSGRGQRAERRAIGMLPAGHEVLAGSSADVTGFPCVSSFRDLVHPMLTIVPALSSPSFKVEVEEISGTDALASDAMLIAWHEKALAHTRDPLIRLGQLTCLAGRYDRAAIRFAAYGRSAVARTLLERKLKHLNEAEKLAQTLDLKPGGEVARRLGDPEVDVLSLVRVPALASLLMGHVNEDRSPMLLLALLAWPETRRDALAGLAKLPKSRQLGLVMVLAFAPDEEAALFPGSSDERERELVRVIAALRSIPPEVWRGGEAMTVVPQVFAAQKLDPSWITGWQELVHPMLKAPMIGALHGRD